MKIATIKLPGRRRVRAEAGDGHCECVRRCAGQRDAQAGPGCVLRQLLGPA
jgi:hypothetical protein